MSAIAGIYYPTENPIDNRHLQKMTDRLSYRGSDDAGIWSESFVGFGHRMLWTTPESLVEKLPLSIQNGKLAITADARIDNRDELIDLLCSDNISAKKVTDSQLILSAYEKWGESCVDKLIGDFAFAIWDRQQKSLFCARDHFGVRPFYYYYSNRAFIFASAIKGILCLPEIPCKPNQTGIGDYLALTLQDKQNTFYENIFRLPPACTVKVNREGMQLKSYWSADAEYELKLGSDAEYADKFREIFTEAVRCRLRSAYPVGSMLSGGLDSSAITCTVGKINRGTDKKLNTYSFVFDRVSESDERAFIDRVVSLEEVSTNYIYGDTISPLVDIEKMFWHQDEPLHLPDLYLNWKTYQLANQQGDRIILDGFDGDNVVSYGLGYLKELKRQSQSDKLSVELREYVKNILGQDWDVFTQKIESKSGKETPNKKLNSNWASSLNSEFIEQLQLETRRKTLKQERYGICNTQRQEHCQDINRGALPAKIEALDKAAAAFEVELRYPFLDKRLVEFCISLPVEQKMQLGWTRMILRRAMEGILPKEIQWRGSKGDLGHNFQYGLRTFAKNSFEDMCQNSESVENYLDLSYLKQTYQKLLSTDKKIDDVLSIWKSLNLYLWLKWLDLESDRD